MAVNLDRRYHEHSEFLQKNSFSLNKMWNQKAAKPEEAVQTQVAQMSAEIYRFLFQGLKGKADIIQFSLALFAHMFSLVQ